MPDAEEMTLRNGDKWKVTLHFGKPEGAGDIVLESCGYGVYVTLPAVNVEPVALIDLFYQSSEGQDPNEPPQITVYSPQTDEDTNAQVKFYPAGTRMVFSSGQEREL